MTVCGSVFIYLQSVYIHTFTKQESIFLLCCVSISIFILMETGLSVIILFIIPCTDMLHQLKGCFS